MHRQACTHLPTHTHPLQEGPPRSLPGSLRNHTNQLVQGLCPAPRRTPGVDPGTGRRTSSPQRVSALWDTHSLRAPPHPGPAAQRLLPALWLPVGVDPRPRLAEGTSASGPSPPFQLWSLEPADFPGHLPSRASHPVPLTPKDQRVPAWSLGEQCRASAEGHRAPPAIREWETEARGGGRKALPRAIPRSHSRHSVCLRLPLPLGALLAQDKGVCPVPGEARQESPTGQPCSGDGSSLSQLCDSDPSTQL